MNKKLNQIYLALGCFVCLFMPLMSYAKALPNIVSICMFLILLISKETSYKNFIKEPYFKALILFLAYIILLSFLNLSTLSDYSEILNIIHLISLIFIFYNIKNKKYLINFFVLGVVISSLITIYKILLLNQNFHSLVLAGAVVEEVFITQRLYLGLFILTSLIFCVDRLFKPNKKTNTIFNLILIVFLSSLIFIFSSRSSIVIFLVVFLTLLIYKWRFFLKQKVYLVAFCFVLSAATIVSWNTLEKRFLYSDDRTSKDLISKIVKNEPRFLIWKFSFEIFSENKNYLLGLGNKKSQDLLTAKYSKMENKKRSGWFVDRGFNTHNQFLDFALNYGLIGFILFVNFFITLFTSLKKNIFAVNLIFSFLIFTSLENSLNRQIGIYLFAFLIIISADFIKREANE